jgi:large subunit ribosomal protein L22
MEVHALASGIRLTPRKARLVAATVVGLPVSEALTVLKFTPRAAAAEVAKVIKSAAANAEHNYELDVDTLRVARIEVDGARTIKRYRPRAQGRAFTILKRTVHVRAVVTDEGYASLTRSVKANTSPGADLAPRRRRGARGAAAASTPAPAARGRGAAAAKGAAVAAEKTAKGRGAVKPAASTEAAESTEAARPRGRRKPAAEVAAAVAEPEVLEGEDEEAAAEPQGEAAELRATKPDDELAHDELGEAETDIKSDADTEPEAKK